MAPVLLALALAASDPPDAVARVRAGLDKPASKLTVPDITPDFKVQIEERRPLQEIFEMPPWLLDPHGWQPSGPVMKSAFGTPVVGFDLLSLFRHGPLPEYAPHTLDEQTQKAIAGYCAAQPQDGRR